MPFVLGVDWGGTYIKAGLVLNNKVVDKYIFSSRKLKDKRTFINQIKFLTEKWKRVKLKGIGIGAPGVIDIKKGFIYYLPNVKGWKNFPLKRVLEKETGLKVFIDNDVNLFSLAEARQGAAKNYSQAIFITLGTGLGGGVMINKKILTARTSAAELGHIPLILKGERCSCGSRGCIETFVGNSFLLKRYYQLTRKNLPKEKVEILFEKASGGESEAIKVWREFSFALGKFLGGLVNIFNPEVIVIGGGIAGAFKLFKGWVKEAIKKQAMWPHLKGLKLLKAKLKDPGIIGAAILVQEKITMTNDFNDCR